MQGTVVGYTEPNGSQGIGIVEGFFSGMYLIKVADIDEYDDERIVEAEENEVEELHVCTYGVGWD
ncbi:hypothetical protein AOL_s00043g273 [Orbilia oligospora ATCC 24927]|uniref:Uncharacterized protein n=2 Tax=Orbilia oligospora TaxID=2813651 RepID=G1X3K0_ARTOA|nr:hypothetical protein AOL_s00043g273 [Orbilia oligospora ATCC 24927]EGX52484.1 hypothetical protein AOL_s00043g273 [Orbilia oligospora ATCC 24927]KAF3289361.1 hypothetical protein TWF970_003142 [Orbilia oligospora]